MHWKDPRTLSITVDLTRLVDAGHNPVTGEYRRSSTMIDPSHPKIIELVQQASQDTPPEATPIDQAQALRGFVHRYVRAKDLSVGLATASEVALTRQGDCTEHAVLLAAMLRVVGIPSGRSPG